MQMQRVLIVEITRALLGAPSPSTVAAATGCRWWARPLLDVVVTRSLAGRGGRAGQMTAVGSSRSSRSHAIPAEIQGASSLCWSDLHHVVHQERLCETQSPLHRLYSVPAVGPPNEKTC